MMYVLVFIQRHPSNAASTPTVNGADGYLMMRRSTTIDPGAACALIVLWLSRTV